MTATADVVRWSEASWVPNPEDEDEDDGWGNNLSLRCYSGDTLVARGELRPGSINDRPGIWGIFVDENHRCRGHAREIMHRLIALAVARGYTEVLLWVEPTNSAALALYDSLGFIRDAHYPAPIRMTLAL